MTHKMMLACKPCAAHPRARFKGLRTTLRKGFALVCATVLAACAEATELEYLGKVYSYRKTVSIEGTEYELDDATERFCLRSTLSRFLRSGYLRSGETYVAVPVTVKSGSKPTSENVAISLKGIAHPSELSDAKVYDDQAFMKMVCPVDTSKWEDWGDYSPYWGYEDDNESREWPKDVWPDKTPVSNRYWVLAQLNGKEGNWSGLTHLRIEVRDDNGSLSPRVVPIWCGDMVDLQADNIFGGSSMSMKPESKDMWVMFDGGQNGRVGIDYDVGIADRVGLQIDVKEAGTLRVVYLGDGELEAKGKNILSTRDNTTSPDGIWWLEVDVSAATTLTVCGTEEDDLCDVNIYEVSFWPDSSRCVRVVADYAERCDLDDGCGSAYLRGYVLGSGVYKSGEKATLTAVAGKTAVFVRWESDEIELGDAASTNACLSFTVPDSVCADAADRAEVRIRAVWRDRLPGEIGPAPSYAVVLGAQVSITVPDLVGYAAKGLPAGLKFDAKTGTISGAATKADTVAAVTFTKKGAETYTTQIFVGPLPVLAVECDLNKGKVTGAGAYAAGKKATLRATAAKGYVFAGWYADSRFSTPFKGAVDYRTPSMPYVTGTEDATIYARFVPAEEDAGISLVGEFLDFDLYWDDGTSELALEVESLSLPTIKVAGLPAGLKYDAKTMTISGKPTKPGTYTVKVTMSNATVKNVVKEFRIIVPNLVSEKIYGLESSPDFYRFVSGVSMDESAIMPSAEEGYTLKVSGLPSGMKYDAKTGRVTGVPTKSGTYTVTVTGTKKGEPTETATITVTVDGMPEAVAGTYVGHISDYGGDMAGSLTLTATAAGKLTAKVVTTQGTVSFSAPSWTRVDGVADDYIDGRTFFADMADKDGRTLTVCIAASGEMDHVLNIYRDGNGGEFIVDAVQNAFSRKWYFAADGADGSWSLGGVQTAAEADVTVAFKDGTATVSGQIGGIKVSGSTVLRVDAALSVRLPAFVTVGGKKRIMAIYMYRVPHGAFAGTATLMDER